MFYIAPTGRFYGQYLTAEQQVHQTEGVNDGSWHHIALVRSGDHQQLFVDGFAARLDTGPNRFEQPDAVSGGQRFRKRVARRGATVDALRR